MVDEIMDDYFIYLYFNIIYNKNVINFLISKII